MEYYQGRMNRDTAMEYFSMSVFYEKDSINERLRVQNVVPTLDKLKEHRGIEFVLTKADEDEQIFIFEKRLRTSPDNTSPVSVYYIC